IRIGDRQFDTASPTLVIAEIGVNHDGLIERALELVRTAKEAGADAVKLQVFRADALMHTSSPFAGYQKDRVNQNSPADMLRQYELSIAAIARIVAAIREAGMIPIVTPFSVEDVETIEKLEPLAVKIASPDLVNRPLLERAARTGAALLISTGASTID